jgi:hypothetical protein
MRYYRISIQDTKTGKAPPPSADGIPFSWTSYANGRTNPAAQDIEIDIQSAAYSLPTGGSFVKIYGVSLQQIAQASNLNGMSITVEAGMQKGLPLANPQQIGVLARGSIFPAFGNWIGTEQSIDLILSPPLGSINAPANIVHNWKSGTPLSNAISSTLFSAFPGFKTNINISPSLVLPATDPGYYQTIEQYAQYLNIVSKSIKGSKTYPGVLIGVDGTTIKVSDGTNQAAKTWQLQFQDMIGQPTWLGLNVIQVTCVMRGDIKLFDQVKLPAQFVGTTTAQSASQFRQNSAFKGTFFARYIRHVGRFRQADAQAWVTTLELAQNDSPAG